MRFSRTTPRLSEPAAVDFEADLTDVPAAAWAAEMDQLVFRGSAYLEEVVFFHRASRTLLLADPVQNFESRKLSWPLRALTKVAGSADPDGRPPLTAFPSWATNRDGTKELERAFR